MENNMYKFNLNIEDHQPSGCADFSKINVPTSGTLTYTNLDTKEKEYHIIEKTEIVNDEGKPKYVYVFPPPFKK
jgi:hypothetical protein